MFEEELTEEIVTEMNDLSYLIDLLCLKYIIETGRMVTPFKMMRAIILNTFEDAFGG